MVPLVHLNYAITLEDIRIHLQNMVHLVPTLDAGKFISLLALFMMMHSVWGSLIILIPGKESGDYRADCKLLMVQLGLFIYDIC